MRQHKTEMDGDNSDKSGKSGVKWKSLSKKSLVKFAVFMKLRQHCKHASKMCTVKEIFKSIRHGGSSRIAVRCRVAHGRIVQHLAATLRSST